VLNPWSTRKEVIKKIIIPSFNCRLYGLKEKQFNEWKKKFFEQKKWKNCENFFGLVILTTVNQ